MYLEVFCSLHWLNILLNSGAREDKEELDRSYVIFSSEEMINMAIDNTNQMVLEKLDKNNFQAWKLKMMNFLKGKGYWKYIEGEHE